MVDMNIIIAQNINSALKKTGKKQYELADAIGYSRQIVSNMLSGSRAINAIELKKISDFCNVSMESLVKLPEKPVETNVARVFMEQVQTEEAKKGIERAVFLRKILFVFRNYENMSGNSIHPIMEVISFRTIYSV